MSSELDLIIEKAYQLFSKYKISSSLDICKPHCISFEAEKELVKTPLKEVSRDLLDYAYYESARTGTNKELDEMKHFLPRVLELVNQFEFPCHSLEVTFTRLDLDQPDKWDDKERQLLKDFSLAYFRKCLMTYPLPSNAHAALSESISSIIVMFGLAHFDLKNILKEWAKVQSIESVLHLKDLILEEIENNFQDSPKLKSAFSTPEINQIVIEWLHEKKTKEHFEQLIEKTIMSESSLNEQQKQELSWTYEFLAKN